MTDPLSESLVSLLMLTSLALVAAASQRNATFRVSAVLVVALIALAGGVGFSPLELAFLMLMAFTFAISIPTLVSCWPHLPRRWRQVICLALSSMAWTLASMVWAVANGASPSSWASASVGGFFVACSVVIGIASSGRASIRALTLVALLAGVAVALGFGVFWSTRRINGSEYQEVLLLPSLTLGLFAMALAFASSFRLRFGTPLVFFATTTAALLVVSQNRTAWIGCVVIALLQVRDFLRYPARFALHLVVVAAIFAMAIGASARLVGSDVSLLQNRLSSMQGLVSSGPESDASAQLRLQYLREHESIVLDNPLTGIGAGAPYLGQEIAVDSPLLAAVRFGLPGMLLFALVIGVTIAAIRSSKVGLDRLESSWLRAVENWLVAIIAIAPFTGVLDDKGTGLTLLLCTSVLGPLGSQGRKSKGASRLDSTARNHEVLINHRERLAAPERGLARLSKTRDQIPLGPT